MKDTKENKKGKPRTEDREADISKRKFLEKSAKDLGACGYAFYELSKIIKEEIIQGVVDDIKDVIRRP